jgi:hypothetical protein
MSLSATYTGHILKFVILLVGEEQRRKTNVLELEFVENNIEICEIKDGGSFSVICFDVFL